MASLPSRQTRADVAKLYAGYQQSLAQMTMPQLRAHLTELNAQIERDQRDQMTSLLQRVSPSSIDQPVNHSPTPATRLQPSSDERRADRGQPRSAPVSQPGAVDLLASRARMGPRLAAKLVLADARRQSRR